MIQQLGSIDFSIPLMGYWNGKQITPLKAANKNSIDIKK